MREPQNKRRSRREDRYCNWNIFCYVTDEHTCITLVVGVGEGCQEDTGGWGVETIIILICIEEDYTNLMSHSSQPVILQFFHDNYCSLMSIFTAVILLSTSQVQMQCFRLVVVHS